MIKYLKHFDERKHKKHKKHSDKKIAIKHFDKKSSGGAVTRSDESTIKSKVMSSQQLAEELHQQIIRKFEKRKVHLPLKTTFGVLI